MAVKEIPEFSVTIYRTTDGAVLKTVTALGASIVEFLGDDEAVKDGNWLGYRVDAATGDGMPLLDFACTVDGNSITGIPPDTTAELDDGSVIVNDGHLTFSVEHIETVKVSLHHLLYNSTSLEVHCAPN
jgi:hypothetical protein